MKSLLESDRLEVLKKKRIFKRENEDIWTIRPEMYLLTVACNGTEGQVYAVYLPRLRYLGLYEDVLRAVGVYNSLELLIEAEKKLDGNNKPMIDEPRKNRRLKELGMTPLKAGEAEALGKKLEKYVSGDYDKDMERLKEVNFWAKGNDPGVGRKPGLRLVRQA